MVNTKFVTRKEFEEFKSLQIKFIDDALSALDKKKEQKDAFIKYMLILLACLLVIVLIS